MVKTKLCIQILLYNLIPYNTWLLSLIFVVEMFIKKKTPPLTKKGPLFFISAGDPSGDVHSARLINEIKRLLPNAKFVGFAGPITATTGCEVKVNLTQFAVMMLKRAVINIPQYLHILNQVPQIFSEEKPDIVILVDFPSFNWKIAKKAKEAGIPVVYFMPPQIWGWGQWRVKKMRKYVDLVLSCFSFEDTWFKENGCISSLVGHPFFEESRSQNVDQNLIDSLLSPNKLKIDCFNSMRYLTILPGSRIQEITNNLTCLLEVAKMIHSSIPSVHPIFAAFNELHASIIQQEMQKQDLNFAVFAGKTPELMRVATCCLSVSGSVSIELLSLCKPTVIIYKVSKLEFFVLRFLKRVKFITLTNLLYVCGLEGETPFYPKGYLPKSTKYTDHERALMLFPEYLSDKNCSEDIVRHLTVWFTDEESRLRCIKKLEKIKKENDFILHPIELAAQKIIALLPPPH